MSDTPFFADQESGQPLNRIGLLARLKARQQPAVSLWVKELLQSRKMKNQAGELKDGMPVQGKMTLTTDSTRQLLQRVRESGQRTRAWQPNIGTLSPAIFQRFPAEVSERLHRIRPMGLRGMRREASPSPAQPGGSDLILPTGRSEPAGQIGPGSPIPTLSAGMVIPPMAPPSFARREADAADQPKRPGKTVPPEPRTLPPRARLYSRVEEYQPTGAKPVTEPAPAAEQSDVQPSLSTPPVASLAGDMTTSQDSSQPPAVQRTHLNTTAASPGASLSAPAMPAETPVAKSTEPRQPAAQQRVTARKSPKAGTEPSSQPSMIQRVPASRQPEELETRTLQAARETKDSRAADKTPELTQTSPVRTGEAPASTPPAEFDTSQPMPRPNSKGEAPASTPPAESGASQPMSRPNPLARAKAVSPESEKTSPRQNIAVAARSLAKAQLQPSAIQRTPAAPARTGEASTPTQSAESGALQPAPRPKISLPLARARTVLSTPEKIYPPAARPLAKALPRPLRTGETSTPIPPTGRTATRPELRRNISPAQSGQLKPASVGIQRTPAPRQEPAVEDNRGEQSTQQLLAMDLTLPDAQPRAAAPVQPPDQVEPSLPAVQVYSTPVPGADLRPTQPAPLAQPPTMPISTSVPVASKEPKLATKAGQPVPSKAAPLRTTPLITTGVQQSQAPVIQHQPDVQRAPMSEPTAEAPLPGAPKKIAEAPPPPTGLEPAVSHILQRSARTRALATGVQAKKIEPQVLRRPLLPRAAPFGHKSATQSLLTEQGATGVPPASIQATPLSTTGAGDLSQAFAALPPIFKIPPSNAGADGIHQAISGVIHVPEKLLELVQAGKLDTTQLGTAESGQKRPSPAPPPVYQAQPELPLRQLPQQAEAERVKKAEKDNPPAESQSKPVAQPTSVHTRYPTSGLIQRAETETSVTDVSADEPEQIDYRQLAQRVLPHLKKLIAIESERSFHLRR